MFSQAGGYVPEALALHTGGFPAPTPVTALLEALREKADSRIKHLAIHTWINVSSIFFILSVKIYGSPTWQRAGFQSRASSCGVKCVLSALCYPSLPLLLNIAA